MRQFSINLKVFAFALFLCFSSTQSTAQIVPLEKVAKLRIPVKAKPITREKLYTSEKDIRFSMIAQSSNRENLYEIGNMLIKLFPLEGQVDKDGFKGYEYDFEQQRNLSSYYKFTTPAIRNTITAVSQFEFKNHSRGIIWFTAINLAFTKQLGVVIEYDVADRNKADKIYANILKSIEMVE